MGAFKRTAEKVRRPPLSPPRKAQQVDIPSNRFRRDHVVLPVQFKQALGMRAGADKEWRPTSNARNNEMVREAKKFAQHLKRLHKDVSGWTKTMDGESAVRRRNTG